MGVPLLMPRTTPLLPAQAPFSQLPRPAQLLRLAGSRGLAVLVRAAATDNRPTILVAEPLGDAGDLLETPSLGAHTSATHSDCLQDVSDVPEHNL